MTTVKSAVSIASLLEQALALHRSGALADAAAGYAKVLQYDPDNSAAYYYLGMLACHEGRFADGLELARRAFANDRSNARARVLEGRALSALGRHQEALACFDQTIALMPDDAQAHASRADILSDLGRPGEAVESYDRALRLAPDAAADWHNRSLALCALGRRTEALSSLDKAIETDPDLVRARLQRSKLLCDLHRYDDALVDLDVVARIEPGLADGWLGRASVLKELRRYDESLAACDRALAADPDCAEALLCRGNVLFAVKQYNDALAACDRALGLKPDLVAGWFGRAAVLFALGQYDDALSCYQNALDLRPNFAEACIGRGNVFVERQQYKEALAAYDLAVSMQPDLADAWAGRGNVLAELRHDDAALAACDRALTLNPDMAEAWLGRGNVFFNRRDYPAALEAYQRAIKLQPDLVEGWLGRGNLLLAKLNLCDWTTLHADTERLLRRVRQGTLATMPFALLPIACNAADQLQCASRYVRDLPSFPPLWRGEKYLHDRIRVAYLSADFHEHPVAYLMAGVFEHHDKSRFEVTALSFGPSQNTPARTRIESALERFIDVRAQNDAEIADLMRDQEIDIAVDLMGHTQHARIGVLARRPAPVQSHYLGYAGSLGTKFIDYILADPTVIPEQQREFYTERVIWLPQSYLAGDDKRSIAPRIPTRQECGLPDHGFVFCSFNNAYKIEPQIFDIWMRLLRAVPNSVLWLSQSNPIAMSNLGREAERLGVSAQRLIFAPRVEQMADHLARHRQADLFVDTLPYNAHTTASDALWAGLPVVTCFGDTFAGRVAASLLRAVGLPELVTTSLEDYEALALKVANEPNFLAGLRTKLARNRDTYPLFDTARFTRHIEAAYTTMWERHQCGHPPEAFAVKPID